MIHSARCLVQPKGSSAFARSVRWTVTVVAISLCTSLWNRCGAGGLNGGLRQLRPAFNHTEARSERWPLRESNPTSGEETAQ